MSRSLIWLIALAAPTLPSGCGTLANVLPGTKLPLMAEEKETRVFGGVQGHYSVIRESIKDMETADDEAAGIAQVGILISSLDFPFCVIGDTITLPYTLACQIGRSLSSRQRDPSANTRSMNHPPSD
jgi:uncharacterized protein YceK